MWSFIEKQINFRKNLFSFSLLSIQIFTHLLYKTPFMNRPLSKFELDPKNNCYIGTMLVPKGDLHCQCILSLFPAGTHLQGISFWNVFYELTLTDKNMQARICLKVILRSWDYGFLVFSTSFSKKLHIRASTASDRNCIRY